MEAQIRYCHIVVSDKLHLLLGIVLYKAVTSDHSGGQYAIKQSGVIFALLIKSGFDISKVSDPPLLGIRE